MCKLLNKNTREGPAQIVHMKLSINTKTLPPCLRSWVQYNNKKSENYTYRRVFFLCIQNIFLYVFFCKPVKSNNRTEGAQVLRSSATTTVHVPRFRCYYFSSALAKRQFANLIAVIASQWKSIDLFFIDFHVFYRFSLIFFGLGVPRVVMPKHVPQ